MTDQLVCAPCAHKLREELSSVGIIRHPALSCANCGVVIRDTTTDIRGHGKDWFRLHTDQFTRLRAMPTTCRQVLANGEMCGRACEGRWPQCPEHIEDTMQDRISQLERKVAQLENKVAHLAPREFDELAWVTGRLAAMEQGRLYVSGRDERAYLIQRRDDLALRSRQSSPTGHR